MFVENSVASRIRSGIAAVNSSPSAVDLTLLLVHASGAVAGTATLTLAPYSQLSRYIDEIPGLKVPAEFQGVLTVTSPVPVSVYGIRGRYNERNDYIFTTLNPSNPSGGRPVGIDGVFPHLIDGGGYRTRIVILDDTAANSASTLTFTDQDGTSVEPFPAP